MKGGRKPIKIIDSTPYSNIIFLITSGINYPKAISEVRKKDASATIKQLTNLSKKGYVTTKKEKLLNKTIYSVNWEKIVDEFVVGLKEHKKTILSQDKYLKSNLQKVMGDKYNFLQLVEDKNFTNRLKKNVYLIQFLKNYFSFVGKLSKHHTIAEVLGYLLFFGDLNFVKTTSPNIWQTAFFISQQNKGHIPKEIRGMDEKDWKKVDEKQLKKAMDEHMKKIIKGASKNIQTSYDFADKKVSEILSKDRDLEDILILNNLIQTLRFELVLQTTLNQSTQQTAHMILKKYFTEEELERFGDYDYLFKIPKTKENGMKTPKPTEDKGKKDRNTHENLVLSSIKGDGKP